MTTTSLIVKPVSQMKLSPGSAVTIPNVSWNEFEDILQELGYKRVSRVAYSKGILEIMVPLPEHEVPKDLISDAVKFLLKAKGKRYQPFGSTTFRKKGIAGVEPDVCFYIKNYEHMIGRRRLLPDDPPPDLAIETDVTSKTTIEAYEALGVPEVWIYDSGKLTIYLLKKAQYVMSDKSAIFPDLPVVQVICSIIERGWEVGSFQALDEFQAAVAEGIYQDLT